MTGVDRSQLPAVGPDPAFSFPAIVRHVLPNGLQVRTLEHHSVPVVSLVLQLDGGSGADPADAEGLAAVVADMVDEGVGSLSAIDVSDALARIGADYDVDVSPDVTVFSLTTLTRFARRGAQLLCDLVTKPSLRQNDFDRVRQMRLDRLRQLKDLPPAVAERAFLRLLYANHSYGHLAIGNEAALRKMSLEDVAGFHAASSQPQRATLVVAGGLPHAELAAIGADIFGSWTGDGSDRLSTATDVPTTSLPRLSIVPREGAAQSELRIGHLSAPRNNPDYPGLLVMNAILGGQFVSRLNLKLREEKAYTYGARSGFDWRRGISPFVMQASVHTSATADSIRDSLNELDAIRGSRPPSESELFLAKASLTRGYPRNFETAQQVARAVAQLALYDLPDTYFEEFLPKVNRVDADEVVRVAQRWLDPSRTTTLIVGDHSAIADSLVTLGDGQPQILPVEL